MIVFISCLFTFLTLSLAALSPARASESNTSVGTIQSTTDNSELIQRTFTAHLTVDARTRDQWKVAVQRAPGANFNTSFLASSVTIAILPRFEVGTMPIFYVSKTQKDNFNLKWNFLRDEKIDFAIGYSQLDLIAPNQVAPVDIDNFYFRTRALQFITNFHPLFTRSTTSFSYTIAESAITNNDFYYDQSRRKTDEYAVDFSYPVQRKIDVTVGAGLLRGYGLTAYEDRKWGAGSTIAYYRPKKFFSKPAIGFHCLPDGNYWQIFVGSTIY